EVLPLTVPEIFFQKSRTKDLQFAISGWDVRTVDYLVALSRHKAPLSDKLNLRSIAMTTLTNPNILLSVNRYLADRGDARVKDWAGWVANARFKTDRERAQAENTLGDQDPRTNPEAVSYMRMQTAFRMIVLKVMHENKIDVFVNPEQTTPPYLLGGAPEPD